MNRNSPACCIRAALALAVLLAPLAASGAAPEGGRILEDEWMTLSIAGVPAGYMHTVVRQIDEPAVAAQPAPAEAAPAGPAEPAPVIVTSIFSVTRLSRMGVALSIRSTIEFRETLEGALISASSNTISGDNNILVEAAPRGDKIAIATHIAGAAHASEIDWDPEILGPYAQGRQLLEADLAEGITVNFKSLVLELQKIALTTVTIHGRDTIEIDGRQSEFWRGTMTQDILPGLDTQVWFDDDGAAVRTVVDFFGGIEMVRATREKALRNLTTENTADIMTRFFIDSNRSIQNPYALNEAVYRLRIDPKTLQTLDLEDRRQTVEETTPDGVLLRVRAIGDAAQPAADPPAPKFLASSPYIQCKDPEIVALATQAVGDAATPMEKAKRLEKWVLKNITEKDLTVGFASAKEVALSRQGDCTEHAVLLAALLRASGIPSRVAVGIVYWKGKFGYHMWTEAFLNDWTALDATLATPLVDATHIKFKSAPLDTASAAEPFLALVQIIGKIGLTVEEPKE